LKGWFTFDLIASLPWSILMIIIESVANSNVDQLSIVRFASIFPRVMRVFRLRHFVAKDISLRIFQLFGCIIVFIHLATCILYYISNIIDLPDTLKERVLDEDSYSAFEKYWRFFYLTSTLIQGENHSPHTTAETIYASVMSTLGAWIMAFIFANVSLLIERKNITETKYNTKMDELSNTLNELRVSEELRFKIINYFQYYWDKHKFIDRKEFLNELSDPLKNEIMSKEYTKYIETVNIFDGCSDSFLQEICTEFRLQIFSPGDEILKIKERSMSLYILTRGICDIRNVSDEIQEVLYPGASFGELHIVYPNITSSINVQATEYCDIIVLQYHQLKRLLPKHPDARTQMEENIKYKIKREPNHNLRKSIFTRKAFKTRESVQNIDKSQNISQNTAETTLSIILLQQKMEVINEKMNLIMENLNVKDPNNYD